MSTTRREKALENRVTGGILLQNYTAKEEIFTHHSPQIVLKNTESNPDYDLTPLPL